jgi:hypothetical protein
MTDERTEQDLDQPTGPDDTPHRHNEARHDADGSPTDHPTGEGQAQENAEEELPG